MFAARHLANATPEERWIRTWLASLLVDDGTDP
jgi:hypothetical protein